MRFVTFSMTVLVCLIQISVSVRAERVAYQFAGVLDTGETFSGILFFDTGLIVDTQPIFGGRIWGFAAGGMGASATTQTNAFVNADPFSAQLAVQDAINSYDSFDFFIFDRASPVIREFSFVLSTQDPDFIKDRDALPTDLLFQGAAVEGVSNFVARGTRFFFTPTLLRRIGTDQDNPLLPDPGLPDPCRIAPQCGAALVCFCFDDVPAGLWVDPPAAVGYEYEMVSDSLFSAVLGFPNGFSHGFKVAAEGTELGVFFPGDQVDFTGFPSGGVPSFKITGITPAVDSSDPAAFPIQLDFITNTASFNMRAILEQESLSAVVDVKFCSNPNGYNCRSRGVTPVTIFGTDELNVADIDVSSLRLCEASDSENCTGSPVDFSSSDRGDPTTDLGAASCGTDPMTGEERNVLNLDGIADLGVVFNTQEVVDVIDCAGLAAGDTSVTLVVLGQTLDGTPIGSSPIGDVGIDQLLIRNR